MKYLEINKKINIRISLSEYLGKKKNKNKKATTTTKNKAENLCAYF